MNRCKYCDQELHLEPDGVFECGGRGEGVCSFWCAIDSYRLAGRPVDLNAWLDNWILEQFGVPWGDAELGWDRDKHAAAIREHATSEINTP